MPRLRHSPRGFVRQMQMSRFQLWIFVEGLLDRSFYDSICRKNVSIATIPYWIALVQEIPTYQGNGKSAILKLYRSLRRQNNLVMALGTKKTTVVFFLDKDVDDKLGTRARSPHVVYTQFYSAENYLFRFGGLAAAVSAACQIDRQSVESQIGKEGLDWARTAANNWKSWVGFCLFAKKQNLSGVSNYRVSSRFQPGPYTPVDPASRNAVLTAARARFGASPAEFDKLHSASQDHVDKLFAKDEFDIVFNGKWYAEFLSADADQAAAGRQYQRRNLPQRLIATLLMTLDYSGSWARYFHDAIDEITALIR